MNENVKELKSINRRRTDNARPNSTQKIKDCVTQIPLQTGTDSKDVVRDKVTHSHEIIDLNIVHMDIL